MFKKTVSCLLLLLLMISSLAVAFKIQPASADYSGNQCLSFNGVNDYVVFGSSPVFHSAALTFEAWIKPKYDIISGSDSEYGHQSGVIATTRPQGLSVDTGWQVWFSYSVGYLGFAFWYAPAVGVSYHSIKLVWYNDSWYHIAVTYDPTLPNGNIKFFVNGTLDSEINENHTISYSTAGPLEAGLLPGGLDGGHPFGGLIDEVRVWNISRTQAGIQSDWNRTLTSTEIAHPNLIGYWRFDEGSGGTSHDYSIYKNNAALAPAPSNPQWFSPGAPISGPVPTANVIFEDDFESYPAGSFNSDGTMGPWLLVYGAHAGDYPAQAFISNEYAHSGNQSLEALSYNTTNDGHCSAIIKRDCPTNSDVIGYEAYIMCMPGGACSVGFCNIPIATWGRYYAQVSFSDSYIWAGGNELQPFTAYEWYQIRVLLNRNTRVFDVWVNDILEGNNITEPNNPWEILSMDCSTDFNHPQPAYFDDIQVFEAAPFELNVTVVNSGGLPIRNASIMAGNTTAYSDSAGFASFALPLGSYNVSASDPDYLSASWIVDLDGDKNITLTLAYNYTFLGEIPDSDIILTPVETGYNITLLNSLASSPMDVFIEWNYVGTISAGTWQTFSYNHLPNLIVEAASKGSSDYPDAWYKYLLPIPLVPITGQEGAFLQEPVPFAAGSIFVTPYPPVYGQNTTIGVTLHDPFDYTINISRIDFQISSLNIGGDTWTSVGFLSNVTLQSNETSIFSIIWLATVSGHHCVRVVLTYSPESQTLQRNMDIENDVVEGGIGEVSINLVNPFEAAEEMTINTKQQLPVGWQATLEINGRVYDTSSDINVNMSPGQQSNAILSIETNSLAAGMGMIDVECYVNGTLIGGVRKTIQTIPHNPSISISGLGGAAMGFESSLITVNGIGWTPGSLVKLTQGEDILNILFGYATADEEGKFTAEYPLQSMGVLPIPTKISANAENGQSAWALFAYLGNQKALEDAGQCLMTLFDKDIKVSVDGYEDVGIGYLIYEFIMYHTVSVIDLDEAIADAVLFAPLFGLLGCAQTIIGLVTGQYHHLDLIVESDNGTLGTSGQGEYVDTLNASWASGNNFNDSQLILMPLTNSFKVTIDATRAVDEVEPYSLAIGFACGIANRTAFLTLQGNITRGTSIVYQVNLSNWTVSVEVFHDVAVTNVASSEDGCLPMPTVGQGFSANISVTVANQGDYTETFNVTAYTNATIIGSENVTLSAGNSTTVTFTWNTTGLAYGNYTISAYAWPVPGETNTANNNCTGGAVIVTIPGDLNGDGTVDIYDAVLLSAAFNSSPGSRNWNPNADINGDGIVDIFDAVILAGHFNQHVP